MNETAVPKIPRAVWSVLSATRFLLAFWVIGAHTLNFGRPENAFPSPASNALVAVYGFLVVSGFSIHHSIAARPDGYVWRRFVRIFPTHAASILLALAAYAIAGPVLMDGRGNPSPMPDWQTWLGGALLLQGILPVVIAVLFPAWSLSAELVYYALAPAIRRATVAPLLALVIYSCLFWAVRERYAAYYIGSYGWLIPAAAMLWAWIAGWIAYMKRGNVWLFALLGLAGSVMIYMDLLLHSRFHYIVWWIVLALAFFTGDLRISERAGKFLDYLGELSFPLYLIHYPLFFLLYNAVFITHPSWNNGYVLVTAGLLASMLVYHLVDKPFRRWAA